MKTDRLIATLAADVGQRERSPGMALAIALLTAAPVSLAIFFSVFGVRPDVMSAMRNPFFDLKFVVTILLAAAAITISLNLARPDVPVRRWMWLLLLPLACVAGGIMAEMMIPQRAPMMTRMVGSNSRVCLVAVPLMSAPFLVGALVALRRGAPSRPALAGALAGLLSAGLAATLYAAHCTDDSPLFVITWYSCAAAFVAAVGVLVGSRVLRY